MLPEQEHDEQRVPVVRAIGQQGQRDAEKPVKAEFLQDTGVQHGGRRGRGGVGFGRPGVKREKRNQNAEPDEQEKEDLVLRAQGNPATGGHGLQRAQIEAARFRRRAAVEQDQAEEQNETAEPEIDRHFPGRGETVARSPDADQKKSRDQGELMKGVKEKKIERSEGADRATREKKETGVEQAFGFFDRRRKPDGAEEDKRGEEKHEQAEPVGA